MWHYIHNCTQPLHHLFGAVHRVIDLAFLSVGIVLDPTCALFDDVALIDAIKVGWKGQRLRHGTKRKARSGSPPTTLSSRMLLSSALALTPVGSV